MNHTNSINGRTLWRKPERRLFEAGKSLLFFREGNKLYGRRCNMAYIIGSIMWILVGMCIGFVITLFLLSVALKAGEIGLIEEDLYPHMLKAGERILNRL